jgi:hypothetical protein
MTIMEGKAVWITYLLNKEGRRKSLLQGGGGYRTQRLHVKATPELIELAQTIHPDGKVFLDIGASFGRERPVELAIPFYERPSKYDINSILIEKAPGWRWAAIRGIHEFDEPQTVESLVAWEKARRKHLASARTDPENLKLIEKLEAEFKARAEDKVC